MEILDLYDRDGNKLNKTHTRGIGIPLNKNEYASAVDVWIRNDEDEILLTKRHPLKKNYPMKWECTSGCIISGENSITGALREVEEEIGIKLNHKDGKKITRIIRDDMNLFFDIFLFDKNIEIKDTKLQEDEVIDIKWVTRRELLEMFNNGEMVEDLDYICELINNKLI
jgi:isopentenyldiphosphate isomerase